jgi:hypothetical protein
MARRYSLHTRKSAAHNQASFAVKLAKEELRTGPATYASGKDNRELALREDFIAAFSEAKERVRAMNYRFVGEEDSIRQALLEICVAVALGTPYNDFDNHLGKPLRRFLAGLLCILTASQAYSSPLVLACRLTGTNDQDNVFARMNQVTIDSNKPSLRFVRAETIGTSAPDFVLIYNSPGDKLFSLSIVEDLGTVVAAAISGSLTYAFSYQDGKLALAQSAFGEVHYFAWACRK